MEARPFCMYKVAKINRKSKMMIFSCRQLLIDLDIRRIYDRGISLDAFCIDRFRNTTPHAAN